MRPSSVLLLSLLLLATLLLSSSSAKPLPLTDHAPQPLVSRNSIFLVVYIWHFQFQFYNQNIPMYALQSIFIIINEHHKRPKNILGPNEAFAHHLAQHRQPSLYHKIIIYVLKIQNILISGPNKTVAHDWAEHRQPPPRRRLPLCLPTNKLHWPAGDFNCVTSVVSHLMIKSKHLVDCMLTSYSGDTSPSQISWTVQIRKLTDSC